MLQLGLRWGTPESPATMGKAYRPRAQPGPVPLSRRGALCLTGAQRQLKPKGTAEADGFAGCATAPRMGPLAAEERRPRTRVGSRTESGAGSVSGQLPQPRGNQPRITHFLPFLPCSKCHLSCHKAKGHLQTPPTGPSIRFLGPLTQQSLQPLCLLPVAVLSVSQPARHLPASCTMHGDQL